MRRAWRLLNLILYVLLGAVPIGLIATVSAQPERWAQIWYRGLLRLLRIELLVYGQPTDGPALVAGNHVSWLDIAILGAAKPVIFVSKAEVARWPLIGWLSRCGDTQFIERGAHGTQVLNAQLTVLLSRGRSVVIFPEGTTTRGPGVRRFQPRLFAGAIDSGVAVQPFAVRYREACAPYVDNQSLIDNLWGLLAEPDLAVELIFGALLEAGDSRKDIAARTQTWVESALAEPPQWALPD